MADQYVPYRPAGHTDLVPYLTVKGAQQAIDFYAAVFGALLIYHMPYRDGRYLHAELALGDGRLMLCDEFPEYGTVAAAEENGPVTLHYWTPDARALFQRAVDHGARPVMPPEEMYWGDLFAKFSDPFGFQWSIAQKLKEMSNDEMSNKGRELFS